MLSAQFGRLVKERRRALQLSQQALCERAGLSRSILSKLESGAGAPVQTDVLDRVLRGLAARATVSIDEQAPSESRILARLHQRLRQEDLRQRHLRVALELGLRPASMRGRVAQARRQVENWERRRSCSPRYIAKWKAALRGGPRDVAAAMTSFGDWENAMFQNTPWSFLWS